ncbi:type I 3-dehydroquinate dehydratase [Chloroflexota bacterium]
MKTPRICAVITNNDIKPIRDIETLVDLFEIRIDLIGDGWENLVGQLNKPWIACNRIAEEGGQWQGNEARRIEKLLQAGELGADIIDIELRTKNLERIVLLIKKRAKCLISFHNMEETPPLNEMKEIIKQQIKAGSDICKLVTTAQKLEDNWEVLQLISDFPEVRLVTMAMGQMGSISRVLCPLIGGDFTYASIETGKESAKGQIPVKDLKRIYEMVKNE